MYDNLVAVGNVGDEGVTKEGVANIEIGVFGGGKPFGFIFRFIKEFTIFECNFNKSTVCM